MSIALCQINLHCLAFLSLKQTQIRQPHLQATESSEREEGLLFNLIFDQNVLLWGYVSHHICWSWPFASHLLIMALRTLAYPCVPLRILAFPCVPLCILAYPCVPLRSMCPYPCLCADHINCNHNSNFLDNNSHRVYVSVTRCCKFSLYDSARWVVARSQNNLWLAQEILDFGFYCHDKIFYLLGPGVSTHSYFLPTVAVGRFVMHLVVSGITVHELYTAAFGLYIIWLLCRTASIVFSWLPLGLNGVFDRMKSWTLLVSGFTFEPVWILYHTNTILCHTMIYTEYTCWFWRF
jgi:hypothetical protein